MNYYKRHLGDFARDTAHLSQGQVGAYDLLLDWYYANERQLPSDIDDIYRIARAHTKDERKNAAKARAFFDSEGRHKRCDDEIAKQHAQAENNRAIAVERERKKRETNGARIVHESCTNISPSHKPLAIKELKERNTLSADADAIPYQAIVEAYHSALPMLPRVRKLTDTRRRKVKARWHEDKERQCIEYWQRFFAYVSQSDFLTGRSGRWTGCDFEWLVESTNHIRVIEGKYENREAA